MHFTLRPWTPADVDSLVLFANNYEIAKYMTNQFPYPYTTEAGEAFIQFAMQGDPTLIFAIDIDGQASGGIGLHPQTDIQCKNAELGYWLSQPFWGKGIITKAILQMTDYGFATLDINRIFARPFGTNMGSQKALEKAGFVLEARLEETYFKNGVYQDELVYARRRNADASQKENHP